MNNEAPFIPLAGDEDSLVLLLSSVHGYKSCTFMRYQMGK